jgi:hypothetical protein
MINNYIFKKNISKKEVNYFLELNIPSIFNNFTYKICGDKGFYNYGNFSSNKNIDSNNNLLIEINRIQILFISITFNEKEYYDFLDMNNFLKDDSCKKNITINIERKTNIEKLENILSLGNKFKLMKKNDDDEEDKEEDDDEESDDDEEENGDKDEEDEGEDEDDEDKGEDEGEDDEDKDEEDDEDDEDKDDEEVIDRRKKKNR